MGGRIGGGGAGGRGEGCQGHRRGEEGGGRHGAGRARRGEAEGGGWGGRRGGGGGGKPGTGGGRGGAAADPTLLRRAWGPGARHLCFRFRFRPACNGTGQVRWEGPSVGCGSPSCLLPHLLSCPSPPPRGGDASVVGVPWTPSTRTPFGLSGHVGCRG